MTGNKDKEEFDVSEIKIGSGTLTALPEGIDVKSVSAQASQNVFDSFTTSLIKQICAAINVPYEVVLKNFQSSYSASRAALLQAQNEFNQRKAFFITDFLRPIYEHFLIEAISLGRIDAPGFFDNPTARQAYLNAEWYCPVSKALDSQKEVNASILRLQNGLSTYEKEISEMNGGDFDDVIQTLSQERKLLQGMSGLQEQ